MQQCKTKTGQVEQTTMHSQGLSRAMDILADSGAPEIHWGP